MILCNIFITSVSLCVLSIFIYVSFSFSLLLCTKLSFFVGVCCFCVSSFTVLSFYCLFFLCFPGFVGHFLLHFTEYTRKFSETFLLVPQLNQFQRFVHSALSKIIFPFSQILLIKKKNCLHLLAPEHSISFFKKF